MASDLNRVIILGNLTRDPELKYTAAGTALLKGSVANNRSRKSGDSWEEETHYFDFILWGRRAEALNPYLFKGTRVVIEGELRQNRWTTESGDKRSKCEIKVDNLNFAGGKRGESQAGPSGGSAAVSSTVPSSVDDDFEDDIPF